MAANDSSAVLKSYDFPFMDRGMSTTIPNRLMTPETNEGGPMFKLVQNMNSQFGSLGSWFGVFPLKELVTDGYPTIERNGSWFETTPNGILNGQCAMWQFWDYPMSWNIATSTAMGDFGKLLGIVVTSREIFILSPQDSNWYNATPTYAAGTVDVAAGATAVTGVGTAFLTRRIGVGSLIRFNGAGAWYSIAAVTADVGAGAITLQQANAEGALVGVPYVIRRCFGGRNYSHGDNLLYGTIHNGDLYIAGRNLAGKGNGPAVIRVSNIYDNVYTTEYCLAGYDLTGTMTANGSVVADLWDIKGIQILQDGRAVVATSEVPSTKTGIVGNRLRYSSNVAVGAVSPQEIWNTSPAGFIDCVGVPGEISALGRLGPDTLTVHYHRGVQRAQFTAQYDPPLSISTTAAKVGCFAPRTLLEWQGREAYLGSDGFVHLFNGSESAPICDETVALLHDAQNLQSSFAISNCHAAIDFRKNQYRLYFCDNNFEMVTTPPAAYADYTINTRCWVVDLDGSGNVYYETYGPHVTSVTMPAIGLEAAAPGVYLPSSVGGDFGTLTVGINTISPSGVAATSVGDSFLYGQTSQLLVDQIVVAVGNHKWAGDAYNDYPEFIVVTDDLDFGEAGIDKTLSHVLIWFSASDLATAAPPTVEASKNSGRSWITAAGPADYQIVSDDPLMFDWSPVSPGVAEKFRIRIRRAVATNNVARGLQIHRMKVYYQTLGEIEASNPDL